MGSDRKRITSKLKTREARNSHGRTFKVPNPMRSSLQSTIWWQRLISSSLSAARFARVREDSSGASSLREEPTERVLRPIRCYATPLREQGWCAYVGWKKIPPLGNPRTKWPGSDATPRSSVNSRRKSLGYGHYLPIDLHQLIFLLSPPPSKRPSCRTPYRMLIHTVQILFLRDLNSSNEKTITRRFVDACRATRLIPLALRPSPLLTPLTTLSRAALFLRLFRHL